MPIDHHNPKQLAYRQPLNLGYVGLTQTDPKVFQTRHLSSNIVLSDDKNTKRGKNRDLRARLRATLTRKFPALYFLSATYHQEMCLRVLVPACVGPKVKGTLNVNQY